MCRVGARQALHSGIPHSTEEITLVIKKTLKTHLISSWLVPKLSVPGVELTVIMLKLYSSITGRS